jgi:hypothetical protein
MVFETMMMTYFTMSVGTGERLTFITFFEFDHVRLPSLYT